MAFRMCVLLAVCALTVTGELAAQNIPKPRIMVVIPEVHLRVPIPDPAGETEIIRRLTEARFRVVDQAQTARVRSNQEQIQRMLGDPSAAAAIGLEHGAEILIYGEAFSQNAPSQFGMQVCRARVEARAVRCDTAEIIAANGLEASGADSTEFVAAKKALRKAGGLVADYLIERIGDATTTDRSAFVLTIASVRFDQLNELEKFGRGIGNVALLQRRGFLNGLATLDVEYYGSPDAFLDLLIAHRFSNFGLNVVNISPGRLDLQAGESTPSAVSQAHATILLQFGFADPNAPIDALIERIRQDAAIAFLERRAPESGEEARPIVEARVPRERLAEALPILLSIFESQGLTWSRIAFEVRSSFTGSDLPKATLEIAASNTITVELHGATFEQMAELLEQFRQLDEKANVSPTRFDPDTSVVTIANASLDSAAVADAIVKKATLSFPCDFEALDPERLKVTIQPNERGSAR